MLLPMSPPVRPALSRGLALIASLAIATVARHVQAQSAEASPEAAAVKPLPELATEVAFPNLKIERPVVLAYPEDGSNLLFVVEQHKPMIHSFPNDKATGDKHEFLKLPDP